MARLPPCNLAESPLQNGPYQRNHTHSLQQSDATHQKSTDIQYREATAWVWSQVCTFETNGSNSTCEGLTPRRSSPLRPDITYQPRTHDTDPISTPLSKFQRLHAYREARGPRDLRKVYVCGQNRYQWVQLRGKSSTPTSRNIGCINQYQRIVYVFPQ